MRVGRRLQSFLEDLKKMQSKIRFFREFDIVEESEKELEHDLEEEGGLPYKVYMLMR